VFVFLLLAFLRLSVLECGRVCGVWVSKACVPVFGGGEGVRGVFRGQERKVYVVSACMCVRLLEI
jgi:hypothetical protein